jgi:hypothetical protein
MAEHAHDPTLEALRKKFREQMNYIADNMLTGLAWAERALLDLDEEMLKR